MPIYRSSVCRSSSRRGRYPHLFFFQAEDGIRGRNVTGVQTCALPISQIVPVRFSSVADLATLLRPLVSQRGNLVAHRETNVLMVTDSANNVRRLLDIIRMVRSEERRVGKERKSRWEQ